MFAKLLPLDGNVMLQPNLGARGRTRYLIVQRFKQIVYSLTMLHNTHCNFYHACVCILMRDIDIAILSVRLSVRSVRYWMK